MAYMLDWPVTTLETAKSLKEQSSIATSLIEWLKLVCPRVLVYQIDTWVRISHIEWWF